MVGMSTTALAENPAAAPPRPRARRAGRSSRLAFLRRWVSPIAIIVVWQLLCEAGVISDRTMAAPTEIAATAVRLVQDGTLGSETLVSLQRVALGIVIGGVVGL